MSQAAESNVVNASYLAELQAEKDKLDPTCTHAVRLLAQEIDRVQTGAGGADKMLELHNDKQMNLSVKVHLPIREFPKVNFPGRLIGPKGTVMKQFQERTGTKLCVFGRGSMTDKAKEDELRQLGGKYSHLSQDLHVQLIAYGHPVECYRRMSIALHELRPYLGGEDPTAAVTTNGSPYPAAAPMVRGAMPPRGPGPMPPPRGPVMGGPRPAPYPDPWAAGPYHDAVSPPGRPTRPIGYHPGMRPTASPYDNARQTAGTLYGQYDAVAAEDPNADYLNQSEPALASGDSPAAWYGGAVGGKMLSTASPSYRSHPYRPASTRPQLRAAPLY